MEANKPYIFKVNGWFVPDALMQEMAEELDRKEIMHPPSPPHPDFPIQPKVK